MEYFCRVPQNSFDTALKQTASSVGPNQEAFVISRTKLIIFPPGCIPCSLKLFCVRGLYSYKTITLYQQNQLCDRGIPVTFKASIKTDIGVYI